MSKFKRSKLQQWLQQGTSRKPSNPLKILGFDTTPTPDHLPSSFAKVVRSRCGLCGWTGLLGCGVWWLGVWGWYGWSGVGVVGRYGVSGQGGHFLGIYRRHRLQFIPDTWVTLFLKDEGNCFHLLQLKGGLPME